MGKSESSIERQFAKYARSRGCRVVKMQDPSDPAAPDRAIVTPKGVTIYLEFKTPGEEPTGSQRRYLTWLVNRGHAAAWCDNFEDAKNWLEGIIGT